MLGVLTRRQLAVIQAEELQVAASCQRTVLLQRRMWQWQHPRTQLQDTQFLQARQHRQHGRCTAICLLEVHLLLLELLLGTYICARLAGGFGNVHFV